MTQVIVALDVDAVLKEERLLERLKGSITHYKVGLRLFTAHAKRAVDLVHKHGGKVFLDLKLHDIPQTVADAVREAQKLGVFSVSLHLSGGAAMVRAAAEVSARPALWGVTVLTSLSGEDLRFLNPKASVPSMVKSLARMGAMNGADGIVCSAREVAGLKRSLRHLPLRFITPGIRPAGAELHDQKRVMTPGDAARLGIDYIVVGRPITHAEDPLRAAQDILAELKAAAPRALEAR